MRSSITLCLIQYLNKCDRRWISFYACFELYFFCKTSREKTLHLSPVTRTEFNHDAFIGAHYLIRVGRSLSTILPLKSKKQLEHLIYRDRNWVPRLPLPRATTGTPKGDRVDHNRTTPSKEDRICDQPYH